MIFSMVVLVLDKVRTCPALHRRSQCFIQIRIKQDNDNCYLVPISKRTKKHKLPVEYFFVSTNRTIKGFMRVKRQTLVLCLLYLSTNRLHVFYNKHSTVNMLYKQGYLVFKPTILFLFDEHILLLRVETRILTSDA